MKNNLPKFFLIISILIFPLAVNILEPVLDVHAQTADEIRVQEEKLQREYDALQKEIDEWQGVLDDTRAKAKNLQGDITILNAQIKEAEAQIRQKNLAIQRLGRQISEKLNKIKELEGQITSGKLSLAQLIRKTNEIDSYSLAEIMLTGRDISDFFSDLDSFALIKEEMKKHFTIVREAKASTEIEKKQLDIKKNQETDAKYIVESKKKTITKTETEKKQLLTVTKEQEANYQKVMKAPRDTVPFADITKRLGRDWKITPVSCPPGYTYSSSRGYGGGMGPSQFIPSTWELFKDRIGKMVGVSANQADPWNPAHSFMATAMYLSDLGAVAGSYTGERNAACRYYSGRACDNKKPTNYTYGNGVMEKSETIQANIDFLKSV